MPTPASSTPAANTVVKSLGTGYINIAWIDAAALSASLTFTGILDTAFSITDASDPTKFFAIDVHAGMTTAKTLTLNTGAQTNNYTLTIPVLTAAATVAILEQAQTFTGAKTLTGGVTLTTTALTLTDVNVVLSATTGTKFGTATSQKLAFFNSTPVVKPTGDVLTALSNLGLVASPVLSAADIASGTLVAARGGTGVSNAGTITNASNTTITGGGTVALGGFTLTVPATGTAVLTTTAQSIAGVKTFSDELVVSSATASNVRLRLDYSGTPFLYFGSYTGIIGGGSASDTALIAWTGNSLFLGANALSAAQINSSGALILGTDPGGSERLRVGGSVRFSGSFIGSGSLAGVNIASLVNSSATGYGPSIQAGTGATYYCQRWDDYLGTLLMRLNGDGSLILGTDPGGGELLRVGGTARFQTQIVVTGTIAVPVLNSTSATDATMTAYVSLQRSGVEKGWFGYGDGVSGIMRVSNTIGKLILVASGGVVVNDSFTIATTSTPASAAATGTTGTVHWDASYIYICTATDTWKRVAIATW